MPYNRITLRELLKAAFSNADLRVFCSDHFVEVYDNLPEDQNKDERILQLLDYVATRNGFEHLAGLVKAANPEKYKEFEPQLLQAADVPDPNITNALIRIQEELKSDQDYAYLKKRFEAILERISLLSDYKALHDGLHEIQYSYYQNIVASTKIAMDDKYAKYDLSKYLRDYRRVVTDMQDAALRKKVDAEEAGWIAQLEQAGNDLEEGIRKGDKPQMDSSTQTINQVIGTQPTIVNRKLYAAVYAYKESLPEPTDVMNRVRQKISAIAPGSDTVKNFDKGIDALKAMNSKLGALIAEHNTWQDVDNQLRILPDLLEAGISVFNKRWQSLRARIQPYYTGSDDKSSQRLKEADDQLQAAIVDNELEGVRRAFENYCSEASDRFFYVDKSVLELCEQLRLIRNELD